MDTNSEFDFKAFQSAVYKDFEGLRYNIALAGLSTNKNLGDRLDLSFSPTGLATRGCLGLFSLIGRRAEKNVYSKPAYLEKKKRAVEIARKEKIKKILCPSLRKEVLPTLFTEAYQARMVSIVTKALTRKEIAEEFSIERDIQLFSLIINEIWQKGIGKYCG